MVTTTHAGQGGDALPMQPRAPGPRMHPDARDLAGELRRRIRGEVRFDAGSRALYASDLSIYRQAGVPIFGRGCGTSLSGQCCNVAVVIDFSKYVNGIVEMDPDGRTAWV